MLEEANCEILEIGMMVGQDENNFYADDLDRYFVAKRKYFLINRWRIVGESVESEVGEVRMFDLEKVRSENVKANHRKIIQLIK